MFYIILIIAGVVLAANRKQASDAASAPAAPETVTIPGVLSQLFPGVFPGPARGVMTPVGPGIGTTLAANNPAVSNVVVSGPYIYKPGGPVAAAAAAASGGGTGGSGAPSGSGSGGGGFQPGGGPHGLYVL